MHLGHMRQDQRSDDAEKYRRWYKKAAWLKLRKLHLSREPLCKFCLQRDRVTSATVADHINPHRGDWSLFLCAENLQSLCDSCHSSAKQKEEIYGYSIAVDKTGWPIDDRHPANKKRA